MMNKFILLGFCAIIGGLLGFAFLGQSNNSNNPDIDNQTVVENQTEIIVENQTEIDDNTEIIDNQTDNDVFKHNFSQFTLLK